MTRTIVITGASSGFGKGVAQELAAQGHNLVLAARREELIGEMVREFRHAIAVPTDVANMEDIEHVRDRALVEFGQVDVWINNAGVGAIGAFVDIPLLDQVRVVETNLIGALGGSHVAMAHFLERGEGTLINVASIAGKIAMPYYAIYGATKSAVQSLSASLRRELELSGHDRIRVCVVNPWAADTPFFEHAANYTGHTLRMPAIDDPQDVIDAIVGLVDDPQDEVDVSIQSKASVAGSHLTPGLTEAASARMTHKYLMEDAPEAGTTSGAVHRPTPGGTGIGGHVRERIEAEDHREGS
jgi:short-subunit dehydrogenase